MIKIYHNPRCSKSRAGLKFLQDKGVDFDVVDYLKVGISAQEVEQLSSYTKTDLSNLVRTHEDFYKKELKGKTYSNKEWASIISENPKLLHRPIIVNGNKGVWAQPPEKINDIL